MQILATAVSGMQQAETSLEGTANRLARASDPTDSVDLSTEMVNLIESRNSYAVNTKAWQTGDEMLKYTIDLMA